MLTLHPMMTPEGSSTQQCPPTVEVYAAECREVLNRFVDGRITSAECLASLDSALSGVVPDLNPEDFGIIQKIVADTIHEHHAGIPLGSNHHSAKTLIHISQGAPVVQHRPLAAYEAIAEGGAR